MFGYNNIAEDIVVNKKKTYTQIFPNKEAQTRNLDKLLNDNTPVEGKRRRNIREELREIISK